jgi:hypothetical protein
VRIYRFGKAVRITTWTAAIALILIGLQPADALAGAPARGHAARSLNGNAEAHLRLVRSSGSTLIEEGAASGRGLAGRLHATLRVGATFTGSFTFDTRYGSITGSGTAHPHGSGRYESFAGSDVITGGSGRYVHAHGHGAIYGVFDRRTYDVTIQTRGTVYY